LPDQATAGANEMRRTTICFIPCGNSQIIPAVGTDDFVCDWGGPWKGRVLGNLSTPKSVQKLHTALPAKAGYRFYALYDKIRHDDILAHACAQCRSNKGAPLVDEQDFAGYGAEGGSAHWRLRSGRRIIDRTR
jgi:hypothetical protein